MARVSRPPVRPHLRGLLLFFLLLLEDVISPGIDDSFAFFVGNHTERTKLNDTLTAEAWNSVCVGVSVTQATPATEDERDSWRYKVWASLHGRRHDTPAGGLMNEWKGWQDGVDVCFDNFFIGMVTGLTLLPGVEVEEVEEGGSKRIPANCSALVAQNVLTHPLDDSWSIYGQSLTVEGELPEDPCLRTPPRTVRLQGPGRYQAFLRLCQSLGGDLPTEAAVTDGIVEAHNCSTGKYLTWASSSEVMDVGPAALCPVLLGGGGAGELSCLSELDCALCLVPEGLTYTLFGRITDFDRHYTFRTLPDGTFYFQGKMTSAIYQGELGWTLRSKLHSEEFHQRSWVMGRRRWHRTSLDDLTDTLTDNSNDSGTDTTSELLTFTVCNALYFSSDNDVCLFRRGKCDSWTDAPGRSNHRHCSASAIAENYITRYQRSNVSYEVEVITIDKITTVEGKASVELKITFKWQDLRIGLTNFKEKGHFPCEEVWTPSFTMFAGYTNGPSIHPRRNSSYCSLNSFDGTVEMHLEDPLMGITLTRPNITQVLSLEVEFPCQLRLSRYPFGRYMCNLTFSPAGGPWRIPADGSCQDIKYQNDKDLLDFCLEKISIQEHYLNFHKMITFVLHLAAQPDYHITNSFFPSSLIFLICYLSLFFPLECFNERIMVTLTALLVLVTLFSQAMNTNVRTPYYKLIDVWYVVLIFLSFAVVVAIALVNSLRLSKVDTETILKKKLLAAKRCNTASKVLLAACFVALIVTFVLFSQDIL
ncbi:uncharacterized protein LOC127000366 isoform X2 [Eriocheir sinensis]|uniref:uncharacterized protein LOC127000366 isoform X2 n=1 Tax=Eriocheir sinensis TaxID=95602 RepID=UPI0021CACB45|nr:uncharacterized protein LOC127000366 isoform X2 [Eriocheir sinensis]